MPYGYQNKILYIDLTTRVVRVEEPGEAFFRTYLGGWGIIAHELLRRAPAGVDAFAPENPLIFAAGVATGSMAQAGGRHAVGAKSPLTGTFGESDVGGFWGTELKRAGLDAVVITGASDESVYLWIKDGEIEIRDASHLWGRETADVQSAIREELGDDKVRVAQCGPAGERLVRYACVIHDVNRAAGRGGLGAVMGSKRLRAIAVRGTGDVEVADAEGIAAIRNRFITVLRDFWERLQKHGTSSGLAGQSEAGHLPTSNFRRGVFEGAEAITGATMTERFLVGRDSCPGCPIGCKRKVEIEGKVSPTYGGPEYESLSALGSLCCNDDLESILVANQFCNAQGIDVISAGATIAWLMECFEKGMVTPEDTDGIDVRFGDAEVILRLLEMIAAREGFGDTLAEGSWRAAQRIGRGTEAFVVHVKGQEMPMHDGRSRHALGFSYAVSSTGADHIHSIHDEALSSEPAMAMMQKSYGIHHDPIPPNDLSPRKVVGAARVNAHNVLFNCVGWCYFHNYSLPRMRDVIQAITGWNIETLELLKAGERVLTMARAFNVREGFTADDDVLPPRMAEPIDSEPIDRWRIDPDDFLEARSLYYGMMGWDETTGVPKGWKLHELGLGWVADLIEPT